MKFEDSVATSASLIEELADTIFSFCTLIASTADSTLFMYAPIKVVLFETFSIASSMNCKNSRAVASSVYTASQIAVIQPALATPLPSLSSSYSLSLIALPYCFLSV